MEADLEYIKNIELAKIKNGAEYKLGFRDGIKEAVEWIGHLEPHTQYDCIARIPYEHWQSKLKEWGL